MARRLLAFVLIAALVSFGCSSEEDDDEPVDVSGWGPSAIAGGDDGLLAVSDDMVSWTAVDPATSGLPTDYDVDRIVKVPGTTRLIAIVNSDSTTDDTNAQIWFNDTGGTGAWTQADFGSTSGGEDYLDAEHQEGATWDDWDLHDIFFVDSDEGYAVGDNYVLLRTYDGGDTWRDMNAWQAGGGTVNFQELEFAATPSGTFQTGETVNGGTAGQGTVIVFSTYANTMIVNVTTAFADGETVTGATSTASGTLSATGGVTDALWHYPARESKCVFATVATDGTHTVHIGQEGSWYTDADNAVPGVWRLVSNAVTDGSTRTYTVAGPDADQQRGTGEIAEASSDVESLFFFDATTGAAATDDGVWTTTDGASYAQLTGSDNGYFLSFLYSNETPAATGYLYSIDDTGNVPGRLGVTYNAGSWTLDTATGWVVHGDTLNYDLFNVDGLASGFTSGTRLIFMDSATSAGYWGYCTDGTVATMDASLWQDSSEPNMGGDSAKDANPTYLKNLIPTGSSGTMRCLAKR